MPKPLVFDSTPLIYLAKASLTGFLKDVSQEKFTTKSVFEEIGRIPRREPRRGESEFLIEARKGMGYFLNNIKDINESAKSLENEEDEKKLTAITNQIIDTLEAKGRGIVAMIGKLQELGY